MHGSLPINVYLNGQRYGGWWERDGADIIVSSAYGSRRAKAGRGDPEKVAGRLLKEVLEGRQKQPGA